MNEYRPMGFQILPPVIKNLIIINVLVFAATAVLKKVGIADLHFIFGMHYWTSPLFKPWQVITYMFMHADLSHIFFNMLTLWLFGSALENEFGTKKFLTLYLLCGFGAIILYWAVFYWQNAADISWFNHLSAIDKQASVNQIISTGMGDPRVFPMFDGIEGASGATMGILFAFGYLYPNEYISYFIFPIKVKFLVAIIAVGELISGIQNNPFDHIAHFAHVGGMLFAYLLLNYWKKSRRNNYYR